MPDYSWQQELDYIRQCYIDSQESAEFISHKHYEDWKAGGGAEAEWEKAISGLIAKAKDEAYEEFTHQVGL